MQTYANHALDRTGGHVAANLPYIWNEGNCEVAVTHSKAF